MELEDQVISLDLAKRMKELGFDQDSLFYWEGEYLIPFERYMEPLSNGSAYTVAELGEMLPVDLKTGRYVIEKGEGFFELRFYKDADQLEGLYDWHDEEYTEANARAKMLIYLKENNLLEIKEK